MTTGRQIVEAVFKCLGSQSASSELGWLEPALLYVGGHIQTSGMTQTQFLHAVGGCAEGAVLLQACNN